MPGHVVTGGWGHCYCSDRYLYSWGTGEGIYPFLSLVYLTSPWTWFFCMVLNTHVLLWTPSTQTSLYGGTFVLWGRSCQSALVFTCTARCRVIYLFICIQNSQLLLTKWSPLQHSPPPAILTLLSYYRCIQVVEVSLYMLIIHVTVLHNDIFPICVEHIPSIPPWGYTPFSSVYLLALVVPARQFHLYFRVYVCGQFLCICIILCRP